MKLVIAVLILGAVTTSTAQMNASDTCVSVSNKLLACLHTMDVHDISQYGRVSEVTTGINFLHPGSLNPVLCPLIDSTDLSDLQSNFVGTGLFGKLVAGAYRQMIISVSGMLEEFEHYGRPIDDVDQLEVQTNVLQVIGHIKEYGYFDFDSLSLAITYGAFVGSGLVMPLREPPIFPATSTAADDVLRQMLWDDIRNLIRSIKKMVGPRWQMIKQLFLQQSAGVINMNDGTAMRNLINGIADLRSEGDLSDYLEANFLSPILNRYYREIGNLLDSQRRGMQSYLEYVQNSTSSDEEKEEVRRRCQAYFDLHDALRDSGVLALR